MMKLKKHGINSSMEMYLKKDKVYGESMVSEFRNNSIFLPCGCSVSEVSRWTEAMMHMLFPYRCPTLSKKEKSKL